MGAARGCAFSADAMPPDAPAPPHRPPRPRRAGRRRTRRRRAPTTASRRARRLPSSCPALRRGGKRSPPRARAGPRLARAAGCCRRRRRAGGRSRDDGGARGVGGQRHRDDGGRVTQHVMHWRGSSGAPDCMPRADIRRTESRSSMLRGAARRLEGVSWCACSAQRTRRCSEPCVTRSAPCSTHLPAPRPH